MEGDNNANQQDTEEVDRVNPANTIEGDHGGNPQHASSDPAVPSPSPFLVDPTTFRLETIPCGSTHMPPQFEITERFSNLPSPTSDCCIYNVPSRIRTANATAYTPQVVSIGPLHCGPDRSQGGELKMIYLNDFLRRTNMDLHTLFEGVAKWEPRARRCYAGTINLERDEFILMMVADGVFIIQTMLSFASPVNNGPYYNAYMIMDVRPDLILLENQLPFFVIEGLFDLAFPSRPEGVPSLVELSLAYFADLMIMEGAVPQINPTVEIKHFVDLLRTCHIKTSIRSFPLDSVKYVGTHSVTELDAAGVKFEKGPSGCLLDVRFASRKLGIPPLKIQDTTDTVLRNLVAFEQCHHVICSYIIDYVMFMDNLIDTQKDVDLLVENGVIQNLLGDSTAAATLFNRITTGVNMRGSNFYYFQISEELNDFCRVPWHTWKATLKRDYFNTPWRVASTVAAIILLLLTAIQTICSIISAHV